MSFNIKKRHFLLASVIIYIYIICCFLPGSSVKGSVEKTSYLEAYFFYMSTSTFATSTSRFVILSTCLHIVHMHSTDVYYCCAACVFAGYLLVACVEVHIQIFAGY